MVWNIGNGNAVCIGIDPWLGCKWKHTLPPSMIETLHLAGFHFLFDIGSHGLNAMMPQLWFYVESIGFSNPQEIDVWNDYVAILKSSHVRISDDDDALVWILSKSSRCTPKEGYTQLMI